jgi:hypothetical protein
MDIRIQVPMDRALFGAILRTGMRRYFRRLWVFGAGGSAIGLLLLYIKPSGAAIALTAAAAVLCAVPSLMMFMSYRRLTRLPQMPWSYHITTDRLAESTPMFSSSRPWTAVRAVTETRDLWVMQTDPAGIIGLPKRAFTPQQAAELQALLRARGLVPA